MKLQGVVLSDKKQSQKVTYDSIYINIFDNNKILELGNRLIIARAYRFGEGREGRISGYYKRTT